MNSTAMTLEAPNVPHARSAPALINTLQEQIHACLAEFFTGAPFAIVDFPNIRNVGDSAIWLGEIAYLTRCHGVKPAYVSEMYDFSEEELNARVPEGPVFIHGGGNFGDIWMGHQNFRERILRSCVGRPVVQFPQSIHYSSPERVEETARLIDRHGNGIHLGERDCSVQRRHQKIIEEAPSPAMTDERRERLRDLAIRSAVAAGYESAGTLEFLVDGEGNFFFIEINCRIQVEHPVTEMLTGVDLIAEQIRLAAGETLSLRQQDIALRGHAIEFRINAEDPDAAFAPQTGVIETLTLPSGPGVRVDTHLYPGYEVPPFYDSLLAKLIVWGADRGEALARSRRALAEFRVGGIKTNLPFHRGMIEHSAFVDAEVSTNLLDRVGPAAFVAEG